VPVAFDGSGKCRVQVLLQKSLLQRGFCVQSMGTVWENGICVESQSGDNRVALLVEGFGESLQQWQSSFSKQKGIERVGWKCLRVDALSLLSDFHKTLEFVLRFLAASGIEEPPLLYDSLEPDNGDGDIAQADVAGPKQAHVGLNQEVENDEENVLEHQLPDHVDNDDSEVIVIISSDEDEQDDGARKAAATTVNDSSSVRPDLAASGPLEDSGNDDMDPSNFGQVVDLTFLRGDANEPVADEPPQPQDQVAAGRPQRRQQVGDSLSEPEDEYAADQMAARRPQRRQQVGDSRSEPEDEYEADESDSAEDDQSRRRKRKSRRLEKDQRDGRWYPEPHTTASKDERDSDWHRRRSVLEEDNKAEEEDDDR
jgi:hypothetical protein